MKKAIFLGLCCALLAAAGKDGKYGDSWDARLYGYSGSVLVRPAGSKNWANARKGLPLNKGDLVRTGKKSSADISLDGRGMITLNPATEFELKTLKRKDAGFFLKAGRLIMKVTGLKARGEKIAVRTPAAVCAVRGTEFAIEHTKDLAETLVNVFEEGQVEVTSLDENGNPVGETITVIPRHEVRVRKEMEAMTLAESPPSRYKDGGIFSVRRKLGALEKSYEPLEPQRREDEREQAFGGKGGGRTAAGYDQDGQEREGGAGAHDRYGRRKGAAGAEEYAEGGAGLDTRQKQGEQAGHGRSARDAGDDNFSTRTAAQDQKRKSDDGGDGDGSSLHLMGGGGRGGRKGLHHGTGGGGDGGKGRPNLGDVLGGGAKGGAGGGEGNRAKSASAGTGGSPTINPAIDGALSRPASATDKSVGTIVSRVQEKLAATGNEGVISNSELRTMVISAAKTSANDASFLTTLNTSIAERIALAETSSVQTVSPLGSGKSTLSTQTLGTSKTAIGVTSPNITSPVMTNTSINSGSVNTGTIKKKTVTGP